MLVSKTVGAPAIRVESAAIASIKAGFSDSPSMMATNAELSITISSADHFRRSR